MKRYFIQIHTGFIRRVLAVILTLSVCFLFAPAARADDGVFPTGACSDDVQRAETRLSDLGYFKGVVDGRWDQQDADAFAAFATANAVTPAQAVKLLYSNDAVAAAQHGGSVFASGAQGFILMYGTLTPWQEVAAKLVTGQSYKMTSCYSGIELHMVCVSVGNHAKMRPELDWDNATLRGFFSSDSSSEKQPVVILIDGVLVAASIQQAAPVMDGGALPEYSVYFHGSLTDINGIPDAEHETVVQTAANIKQ